MTTTEPTLPGTSPWWWPSPDDIARYVVNSVVLTVDEFAQTAAADYWDMSAAGHRRVVSLLRSAMAASSQLPGSTGAFEAALDAVLSEPWRQELTLHLAELIAPGIALGRGIESADAASPAASARAWRALVSQAVRADAASRLYLHVGPRHAATATVTATDIPAPLRSAATDDRTGAPVIVVIPFRDRSADHQRLRNLLACLWAVGDQTLTRSEYRVVVVELDTEPRHAGSIRDRVDRYLFLPCPGHFNKAWAVNAGVVQAGNDSEIICVLDADILVDRDFLRRNLSRFGARGHQAHWPFRDPLCMDPSSTNAAVTRRAIMGEPDIDPDILRGVRLRRPPGHCVWVRADLFHRIGGMDERFEGWGGEDLDFVFRLDIAGPVDRYDDLLVHMFHPRPQITEDGRRFYAGRQLLTWRPAGPIGQLDAPGKSIDDDLAGQIEHAG